MEGDRELTLLIGIEEQRTVLGMQDVLDVLEIMYQEEYAGRAISRVRSDTIVPNDRGVYGLKSMDGIVPNLGVGAVRINSDIITWPSIGGVKRRVKVPAAPGSTWVGLVLLFSVSTGEPLAIFPDGFVQRMRVGGTSGLAVKYMSRDDSEVLGIIGSGWQAGAQILAACEVRDFRRVVVYSPNRGNLENFVSELQAQVSVSVVAVDSSSEVVSSSDVVLCATNSISPVFDGSLVRPGQHLGCIRNCEIDNLAYDKVDTLAVHAATGKPTHLVIGQSQSEDIANDHGWNESYGRFNADNVPNLAQLITRNAKGRKGEADVTCFVNNIGLGIQFAAVGARLLELARAGGVGHELPTQWFTQNVHP